MSEERSVFRLLRPYAAVQVEALKGRGRSGQYKISSEATESPLCLLKADTLLFPLPNDDVVLAGDDEPIAPTGKFYRTAETIDPYHLVCDIWNQQALVGIGICHRR